MEFLRNIPGTSWLLLSGIALFFVIAFYFIPFAPDDAYIGYRFAEYIAAGNGITFNPSEKPVEGYSNFLWILFCSVLVKMGLDLGIWAPYLGLLFGLGSLFIFWSILKLRAASIIGMGFSFLLFSSSAPIILYSISGMETSLFSFLLLAILWCTHYVINSSRGIYVLILSVLSILLALCRMEGVLVFPIILVLIIYFRHTYSDNLNLLNVRILFIGIIIFIFGILFYNLWRLSYFGTLIPTPMISKGPANGSVVNAWASNLRYLFVKQNHYFSPFGYYYGALVLLSCAALISTPKLSSRLLELVSIITAVIMILVYMNFVDWMPAMRYFAPLSGLLILPIHLLFGNFVKTPSGRYEYYHFFKYIIIGVAIFLINFSSIAQLRIDSNRNEESTQKSQVALGKWFNKNFSQNVLIAVSDIGAISYYSKLKVIDINPHSLTDYNIATNGWSDDYFFHMKPDVAVFVSFSITEPSFYGQYIDLVKNPIFVSEYSLIGITRYDWYMDRSYWVYVHKGIRLTEQQIKSLPKGIANI